MHDLTDDDRARLKRFPILGEDVTVPWEVVEPIRALALRCHGQTLERLAERGGLSRTELGLELAGIDPFDLRRDDGRTPAKDGKNSLLPVAKLAEHSSGDQGLREKRTNEAHEQLASGLGLFRCDDDRDPRLERYFEAALDRLKRAIVGEDYITRSIALREESDGAYHFSPPSDEALPRDVLAALTDSTDNQQED